MSGRRQPDVISARPQQMISAPTSAGPRLDVGICGRSRCPAEVGPTLGRRRHAYWDAATRKHSPSANALHSIDLGTTGAVVLPFYVTLHPTPDPTPSRIMTRVFISSELQVAWALSRDQLIHCSVRVELNCFTIWA